MLLGNIGRSQEWQVQRGACCGIQRAREDKAQRSQLVAGAWRAQVHGVD